MNFKKNEASLNLKNQHISILKGKVIKSTGSWYIVQDNSGKIVSCKLRGKFRKDGIKSTNPLAVGDIVEFDFNKEDHTGWITHIEDRKNYFIRKSSNLSKQSHILAANIDQVLLIATIAYPQTYSLFIDRFLVTAEAYRIPAILVFNKTDLYNHKKMGELQNYISIYKNIGYKCMAISALKKDGIEEISQVLKQKTTLLVGNSGVGKTTIINAIDPKLNLKTKEISDYHQLGKHSTTFAEMFELSIGGNIIDTPGIKGFGLIDFGKEELFHFFPEIFRAAANCKYYNCTHIHEPGCAVKAEVQSGNISEPRYNNYIRLLTEEENKHRL